jgi:ubiquitin-protein ligase E3 C
LGTEAVLRAKNDKDLKHEKDLAEVRTSSAISLAAKEARVDRSKSFWQSSSWARKVTSTVVSFVLVISVRDLISF